MLKKVGIIVNYKKDKKLKITKEIIKSLLKYKVLPVISPKIGELLKDTTYVKEVDVLAKTSDIIIVLGGDGTYLGAARNLARYKVKLLPVNIGGLGFIAEINKDALFKNLRRLLNKDFKLEKRSMLAASLKNRKFPTQTCTNDILISKQSILRLIRLKVLVDEHYLSDFKASGLLISTPTGSTAHSLSAGAPIIHPKVRNILITPLCAHSLSVRPIIIPSSSKITVEVYDTDTQMSIDGQDVFDINSGDKIIIRSSPYSIELVKLEDKSFYNLLREKLFWKG